MIPAEEFAQLLLRFDRFANHLDPLSEDWKQCKEDYFSILHELHDRFAHSIPFEQFRREAQRACFQRLRSEDKPSTPPPEA